MSSGIVRADGDPSDVSVVFTAMASGAMSMS